MRIRNFGRLPFIGAPAFSFNPEGDFDMGGGGTPTPTPAPVNTETGGGNPGAGGSGESSNNNAGDGFDPATFWGSQAPGEEGSPESESATGDQPGSGAGLKEELTQKLQALTFGENMMTPEIAEAFSNGDFTGFQTALDTRLRQVVNQSLALSVSVLRPFSEQMMAQVREEIRSTMGARDDSDQLVKDFPTAANPQIRPVVENLYTQALKNTKGNRPEAVKQVKSMMRLMSQSAADDLGLNVAPRTADDSGRPQTPVNWLDELSARP